MNGTKKKLYLLNKFQVSRTGGEKQDTQYELFVILLFKGIYNQSFIEPFISSIKKAGAERAMAAEGGACYAHNGIVRHLPPKGIAESTMYLTETALSFVYLSYILRISIVVGSTMGAIRRIGQMGRIGRIRGRRGMEGIKNTQAADESAA